MDMAILKELETAGADIPGAIERFMGNEALYMKFLTKFLEDKTYSELMQAYSSENIEEIFRAAHTFKGVTANLGLNMLLDKVVNIVECGRGGEMPSKSEMDDLDECYRNTVGIIEKLV